MTSKKQLIPSVLLWGGKSKARIINEMIAEQNCGNISLIFDHSLDKPEFLTKALFTNSESQLELLMRKNTHFVVCVGGEHGEKRVAVATDLEKKGLMPLSLIHQKSFIEATSKIGKGLQAMPGCVVHKFCKLGDYVIINTNATVDHECTIHEGVHVMGGASIAGRVTIEKFATIGTNATVLPNLSIGEGSFVGAGSVVTKNVNPYTLQYGVPAKEIRYLKDKR